MRGTPWGLKELIRIITDKEPFIVENIKIQSFKDYNSYNEENLTWCKNQHDTIFAAPQEEKELSERLYGKDPFSFCVLLKESLSPSFISALKEIIEEFKPAHTRAGLRALEPWFYLDGHTYLGINTILNRGYFVIEVSCLGRDTTLTDMEECAQVGRKSRVEIDFKII